MKKKTLLSAFAILVVLAGVVYATDQAFNVQVVLANAITIAKNQDLDFGTQIQGTTADVTVDPAAGTGPNGEVAANFTVTGDNGYNYVATTQNASTTLDDGGGNTITVDTYLIDDDGTDGVAAARPYDSTFGAATTTLYVGATCHILATDPAGTYIGSETLQVVYN